MVEFALVLPVLVMLLVGIVDLARIYTTMLSVESAAREAADFGSFGSHKWNVAVVSALPDGTEASMERRACTAASNLPDYAGPNADCANPRFRYDLSADRGATWVPYSESQAACPSGSSAFAVHSAANAITLAAQSSSSADCSAMRACGPSGHWAWAP